MARLDELQKELIRKANSKQDYDAIADEIFTLRGQKSQAEADTRSCEETRKRIAELQDFIGSQQSEITEFVRKLIQQITVYGDRFTVRFVSAKPRALSQDTKKAARNRRLEQRHYVVPGP